MVVYGSYRGVMVGHRRMIWFVGLKGDDEWSRVKRYVDNDKVSCSGLVLWWFGSLG
jgi:hypothetical protein